MAIKFLSGLNLSNVTAGSILKLDSSGNIVAAVDGTDYNTNSADSWSATGSDIYRNSDVRIGTYQSGVAPAARLHVFDYQTTDPKLLIEDGNTGDASMQFKISTQQYTMGIDNSDSDKFIIANAGGFNLAANTHALEISTAGKVTIPAHTTNGAVRFEMGGFNRLRFNSAIDLLGYTSDHLWVIGNSTTNTINLAADWDWDKQVAISYTPNTVGGAGGVMILGQTEKNNANWTHGTTKLYTNGTERLRIDSNGNVGIGVTSPATDLSLGDGTHTSPDDTDRILNWYSATGGDEIANSSHYITVGQSSSDTTQPKSVGLALFNQNTANNTYSPAITFGGLSTSGDYMNGAAAIAAQLIANTNDSNFRSGELTFYTQGSTTATRGLVERMRINNYGAVLIGTTNTNSGKADFAVGSPQISWYSGQVQIGGTDMNWNAKGYVDSGVFNLAAWDGNIRLFTQGSSTATSKDIILSPQATGGTTTERVRLKGDTGNFGIGTTDPKAPLHVWTGEVSGSLQEVARLQGNWTSNPSGPLLRFTNQHNSGDNPNSGEYNLAGIAGIDDNSSWGGSLYFYTSPTGDTGGADLSTRMVIKSDGKVGIGTTNPNYKLDVNGTLRTTTLYSPIVRVSGSSDHLTLRSDVQVDQGATDPIIEFAYGTTQMGKFDQDGYMYATGFKTTTASTGFLKADGSVDTTSYQAAGSYLTSISSSDVTTALGYRPMSGAYGSWSSITNGSSGDWFPLFSMDDGGDGSALVIFKTYAHDSVTFAVSRGYSGSNNNSINVLNSVNTPNSGYATVQALRVRNNGVVEAQLVWSSGPSVQASIHVMTGDDNEVSIESDLETTQQTATVNHTVNVNVRGLLHGYEISSTGDITTGNKLYITTADANTTSTSALVLNGTEVEKRTLGSNAFNSTSYLPLSGGTVTGMTIFEDGMRIGTGNHYTDGRASITFGEGTTTSDSMYIEYDGENLNGDSNAIIFGSAKSGVGDVFRVTYGGSVLIGSNAVATESYVTTQISNLVDSAPAALDTLNELAAALGDDASFSTTMSTALGNRLRVDVNNQGLTSTEKANGRTNLGLGSAATAASTAFVATSGDTMTGKLTVNAAITAGGKTTYKKVYSSLDTTGQEVAGLTTGSNGGSALFTFTCYGGAGEYQRIVFSCHNTSGTTWNVNRVIDEGTNAFDIAVSDSGSTRTFTFKGRTSNQAYSPTVVVEHVGHSLNGTYL